MSTLLLTCFFGILTLCLHRYVSVSESGEEDARSNVVDELDWDACRDEEAEEASDDEEMQEADEGEEVEEGAESLSGISEYVYNFVLLHFFF